MSIIREPSVTVNIPLLPGFTPYKVVAQLVLNAPPILVVTGNQIVSGGSIQQLSPSAIMAISGQIQNEIYANRTEADVIITLNDGANGELTFQGIISASGAVQSAGEVSLSITVSHVSAFIGAINFTCYQRTSLVGVGGTSGDVIIYNTALSQVTGTLAQRINTIASLLTKSPNFLILPDPAAQVIAGQIHANNLIYDHYFASILAASPDDGWGLTKAIADGAYDVSLTINSNILDYLLSSSDMMASLSSGICRDYLMYFMPAFSGAGVGSLRSIADAVTYSDSSGTIATTPQAITFSCQSTGSIPIVQTVVSDVTQVPTGDGPSQPPEQTLTAYPTSIKSGGRVVTIKGPPWIRQINILSPNSTPNPPTNLQPADYRGKGQSLTQFIGAILDSFVAPAQQRWARLAHLLAALGSSTATVTTPLDVTKTPGGPAYKVTVDGTMVLAGFLDSVTHSLTIGRGRGSSATTTLGFSYVRLGSVANLPNIPI